MRILALLVIAVGTYLMRFLPLRYRELFSKLEGSKFLEYSSTAIIAALFVGAFTSSVETRADFLPGVFSIVAAYVMWRFLKNLGISVLSGVAVHYLVSLLVHL